ncbi:MAG TPA: hypothetical protein PLL12_13770, partial [Aestuariivirga sp.]|nr:hypothetical protein [Aestuariivirga sp.]
MKINPLAIFTGLTLATFGALIYVEQQSSADDVLMTTAKVEPPAPPTAAEPPKPAEPVVAEPAPAPPPVVEPAPAPETQVAAVEEPPLVEPPKPAEPVIAAEPPVTPAEPAEEANVVPSFDTVRVEPTGDAVIAGRAAPGAEVVVKFNGAVVGSAVANE